MNVALYSIHALYYLAEAAGWRSGLRWQLSPRGVFSPDLQRLLALGRPPRPPREALERVKLVVEQLCSYKRSCGYLVIAAAKYLAYERLGISYGSTHVLPPSLEKHVAEALESAGLLRRKETIITPKPVAH